MNGEPRHDGTPVRGSVGTRVARGAAWAVSARLVSRVLGLLGTIVLARLLAPADFGLVAMATAVLALLELFSAFGFDAALIRVRETGGPLYDTAWSLNAITGIALGMTMCLLAVPAAGFFSDERVAWILIVLSAAPVLEGLQNIGIVAFRKDLDFRRDFLFLTGKKAAMLATAIPLAAVLSNYWALVVPIVISRLVGLWLSYSMHPYRPRFCMERFAELFGFSKWVMANNVGNFLRQKMADLALGRLAGAHAVGLFSMSFEMSNLPTSELVMPINRAVYPGFSLVSNDIIQLRRSYLSVTSLIALLAVPAGAGIAAIAPVFTPLVLGHQWLEAVPLIQILAIYGVVAALQGMNFSVYLSLGVPRVAAWLNFLQIAILAPVMIAGISMAGVLGAAWAVLIAAVVMTPVNFVLLSRYLDFGLAALAERFWRPAAAALVMVLVVHSAISGASAETTLDLIGLNVLAIACGLPVYVVAVVVAWRVAGRPQGAERLVLERVSPALTRVVTVLRGASEA